ncbi:MAG: hypothetical protein OEX02_16855, partial [Cyclobacteriaceae bacterium]|nr:hypothetical protein [Cyclobacteriaceae bacterium]
ALPEEITPDYLPVIEVEYDGEMVYSSLKQIQAEYDNSYVLGYDNARQYHSFSGREYYSLKPTVVKLSWQISPARSLDMMVTARHDSLSKNRQYVLAVNGQEYPWKMEAGEVSKALGIINLHADKPNTIELWATDRKNPHVDMEAKGLKIVFSL